MAARRRKNVAAAPVAPPQGWRAPKYRKSAEEEKQLFSFIQNNVLFNHLGRADFEDIVGAFQLVSFPAGQVVIRQGDPVADTFFVFREGSCRIDVNGVPVKDVLPGDSFGELALLYDAPRAATVTVTTNSQCWVLDRVCQAIPPVMHASSIGFAVCRRKHLNVPTHPSRGPCASELCIVRVYSLLYATWQVYLISSLLRFF